MEKDTSSPVAWMAKNHIPANFLMLLLLIGGYVSLQKIKKEVFPEIYYNIVTVSVAYPGAQPDEIERSIIQTVESEIQGIDGIKEVSSVAQPSQALIVAELEDFVSEQDVYLDIKNAVDSITTFPVDSREPNVSLNKRRSTAVTLVLYGDQPYATLYNHAQKVKNQLINRDDISLATLDNLPQREIIVEIKHEELKKYNLSIEEVSNQISTHSRELSAGTIKSVSGDILIKTDELKEYANEFNKIPIITSESGNSVYLEDIAEISESYEEDFIEYYYNGLPAFKINVFSIGDESPIDIADSIKSFIEEIQEQYDGNITLGVLSDRSKAYRERIDLLMRNAASGLILVLLILGLFLDVRLAFWVMLGVPISILGSFIFIHGSGGSLNMVSLFAFIITLGIVVDDAVIVGEAIYEKRQNSNISFIQAAVFWSQRNANASDLCCPD